MTDLLQSFLSTNYQVLGLYDLAEISENTSKVYQILNHHHRKEFLPNQVIVFYTQYVPSEQLLLHLFDAAKLIDIDPFFILLCGPLQIQPVIDTVCKNNNSFKLVNFQVSSKELKNKFYLPDTFCPLPWTHLEVRENGFVFPCCISTENALGIIEDGLIQTFHSEKMITLRQEFLEGKKPNSCINCWSKEHRGLISNRIRHRNFIMKETLIKGLDTPTITRLDIKCGKTCNFKCRICSSERSSLFAEEEARYKKIKFNINKNWSEDVNNISEIVKLLPTLSNIDMTGGEPFLVKSLSRLLKLAVEQGHAKKIRLHYNTNGSIYPKEFIQYWPEFKEVDIHFSIDALGDKFELERGGTWNEVEANILKIKNLNISNMKLAIMPAISIMNIFYIDEVLMWAKKHNFIVNPNHVIGPEAMSLSQLTGPAKNYLIDKFKDNPWPEMKKIIQYIQQIPDSNGEKFIELTKHFDSIRKENFSDSHPEIAKAMGYKV